MKLKFSNLGDNTLNTGNPAPINNVKLNIKC